jgi:hypothetical protein
MDVSAGSTMQADGRAFAFQSVCYRDFGAYYSYRWLRSSALAKIDFPAPRLRRKRVFEVGLEADGSAGSIRALLRTVRRVKLAADHCASRWRGQERRMIEQDYVNHLPLNVARPRRRFMPPPKPLWERSDDMSVRSPVRVDVSIAAPPDRACSVGITLVRPAMPLRSMLAFSEPRDCSNLSQS